VAEENTALVADEGAQPLETELVEQQQDETPEPIANLAKELGWVSKDEFRGEPEKWKPAEQFIRDGRDIQQTTARELRSLREQMERVGSVTETIIQDRVTAAQTEWQRKMTQAVDDGDTETALKLADQRPTAKPNGTGADPTVQSWVAKNPWFNTDPLARVRAEELSGKLAHLPVPEQLAQVERAMKREFPEHFPAPVKAPPSTQTATGRNANPSNRTKGFADMPMESQQVARDFERLNGVSKDDFAKQYWANQAKKGSRA
jgi:hypothetical protein